MAEWFNAAVSKTVYVGSNPTSGIRIGLKEVFNIEKLKTKMGAPEKFHFRPNQNSTVFQLLKNYKLKTSVCTPFCVGTLDYRLESESCFLYGASSSGTVKDIEEGEIQLGVCTDTGGSALFPAARKGYYCYRPTHNRISRAGLVPLCDELDTVSLISKKWAHILQIYGVLAKVDPKDPKTTLKEKELNFSLKTSSKWFGEDQLKIIKNYFKGAYFSVEDIDFTEADLRAIYNLKMCPSFFSIMCKFDGFHHTQKQTLISEYRDSEIFNLRTSLSPEIKSRIALGAFLLKEQNKSFLKKLEVNLKKNLENYRKKLGEAIWIFPAEGLKSNEITFNRFPVLNNILKRACAGIPLSDSLYVYVSSPPYTDEPLIKWLGEHINTNDFLI